MTNKVTSAGAQAVQEDYSEAAAFHNFEKVKVVYRSECPGCKGVTPPVNFSRCVLNRPLMISVPPEGMHISCPAHPEGHHLYGTQVTC